MARIVKEEEYTIRRNEILDITRQLVYTRGYEQMTIQDILDALKISKGAFYHYFDSKQALLEALIERMLDEASQVIGPIVDDPSLPAIEKLERYFHAAANWKAAQKDFMLALLQVWYNDNNAVVRQKMLSATVRVIGPMMTKIVQQGVGEGVFHIAYPDMVGELIITLFTNMGDSVVQTILSPDPNGDNFQRLKKVMAAFTEALERVLGAPPGSLELIDPEMLRDWVGTPERV